MRFLLTTEPGLETMVVDELCEQLPDAAAAAETIHGGVLVEAEDPAALLQLGTVEHLLELRREGRVSDLDDVRKLMREADFDELARAESFRVSSRIEGDCDFDRIALQGAAGAVLVQRFGTSVDLERFELEVRVDLIGDRLFAGFRRNRDALSKRIRRGRALRSSLKPTIAAAMLRLAGAHRGPGELIDPMCGSGVIPVEALRLNPRLSVAASDWDEPTVEVARATLVNHEFDVVPDVADARSLGARAPARFDYIVTEPPYGMRLARRASLTALYVALLDSFARALKPEGRLAIVVVKHRVFAAALRHAPLQSLRELQLRGGKPPRRIYLLTPRSH